MDFNHKTYFNGKLKVSYPISSLSDDFSKEISSVLLAYTPINDINKIIVYYLCERFMKIDASELSAEYSQDIKQSFESFLDHIMNFIYTHIAMDSITLVSNDRQHSQIFTFDRKAQYNDRDDKQCPYYKFQFPNQRKSNSESTTPKKRSRSEIEDCINHSNQNAPIQENSQTVEYGSCTIRGLSQSKSTPGSQKSSKSSKNEKSRAACRFRNGSDEIKAFTVPSANERVDYNFIFMDKFIIEVLDLPGPKPLARAIYDFIKIGQLSDQDQIGTTTQTQSQTQTQTQQLLTSVYSRILFDFGKFKNIFPSRTKFHNDDISHDPSETDHIKILTDKHQSVKLKPDEHNKQNLISFQNLVNCAFRIKTYKCSDNKSERYSGIRCWHYQSQMKKQKMKLKANYEPDLSIDLKFFRESC